MLPLHLGLNFQTFQSKFLLDRGSSPFQDRPYGSEENQQQKIR